MKYDEFKYWFKYKNINEFNIIEKSNNSILGSIDIDTLQMISSSYEKYDIEEFLSKESEIKSEFEKFQIDRDEWYVGQKFYNTDNTDNISD